MKTHKELLKFCLDLIEKDYCPSKPVEKGMHPVFYHTLSYEGDVALLKEIEQAIQTLSQKEEANVSIEDTKQLALEYWQNDLAKFFPKQNEPTYTEYKMFYEGYKAGLTKLLE